MRSRQVAFVGIIAVMATSSLLTASAEPLCDQTAPTFGSPVTLGVGGRGYEPGIEVDSAGTIFVTAHKLNLVREEGTRLASYLWRSTDGGASFHDISGLAGATNSLYALEGDLAVDGHDRLYFVDTWAADNHVYRFSDHGSTLDFVRPAVPGYEVDDRPWIAAHQDGFVYYMSNTGWGPIGRLTIHRSTNGGLTFDPVGHTIPESGWGFLDADPNSDYVYAFTNDLFYATGVLGAARSTYISISPDRGATWSKVKVADYVYGYQTTADHDDAYPVVAVSPVDGSVYTLFTDNGRRLVLSRSTDRGQTWTTWDVAPFAGVFSYAWLSVSETGDVGITFHAKASAPGSKDHIYAMIWRPEAGCQTSHGVSCTGPASAVARVSVASPGGFAGQADFFQTEFTPDGAMNVVWTGRNNIITYSRQTSGANIAGTRFCGAIGGP